MPNLKMFIAIVVCVFVLVVGLSGSQNRLFRTLNLL